MLHPAEADLLLHHWPSLGGSESMDLVPMVGAQLTPHLMSNEE